MLTFPYVDSLVVIMDDVSEHEQILTIWDLVYHTRNVAQNSPTVLYCRALLLVFDSVSDGVRHNLSLLFE